MRLVVHHRLDRDRAVGPAVLFLLIEIVEKDADFVISLLNEHVETRAFLVFCLELRRVSISSTTSATLSSRGRLLQIGHDRCCPALFLGHAMVEIAELVKALIDHEAIRHDNGLSRVI